MAGPTIPSPATNVGGEEAEKNDDGRVTWLGHATAVIEVGRGRMLVDPLFRGRARRAGAVDAVLITHSHVDHLSRFTLKAIDRATRLIVPRGAAPIVADLGFSQVTEVEPGDALEIAGCEVHAVPTRHDHGRWKKGDGPIALGYVVKHDATAVHHAGDVDVSDHSVFDDIGKQFTLAATLLPIGGMLPVWWYRMRRKHHDRGVHIDPDCALDIHQRLGAASMVPIHWGTVHLPFGLPSMPARRLIKVAGTLGVTGKVRVLDHGGALRLAGSQVIADHPEDADQADREADQRAEQPVAHGGT
jgi:L-ascorbate metabolism protein UlaG (beta-lactamase superfamily)